MYETRIETAQIAVPEQRDAGSIQLPQLPANVPQNVWDTPVGNSPPPSGQVTGGNSNGSS